MSIILAIDPGTTESAYVLFDAEMRYPIAFDKVPNAMLLDTVADRGYDRLIIEEVRSYGMPVGREVFETVKWYGRFHQAALPRPVDYLGRVDVKSSICHSAKAKDPNVRSALLDRYGGKDAAIGRKARPGPLYAMSGDMWAALGVAEAWADRQEQP